MSSIRTQRIAKLIKEELSQIFMLKVEGEVGDLITITSVKVTPDLKIARVYFSIFDKEGREETLARINNNKKKIRYELAQRVRNLRFIPELEFFVDDTQDYVDKMEKLFSQIHEDDNKENQ
jgi:ribosome-binding factor A